MPFFQNLFDREFRGTWILGDRQYTANFDIKGNINSSVLMVCWNSEPYNLSSLSSLTINYAIDPTLKQFASLTVNVQGVTSSATMAWEVAAALNAAPTFSGLWTASAQPKYPNIRLGTVPANSLGQPPNIVAIQSKRQNTNIRAYISNTGAEEVLQFNLQAPIAELPTYFARHTIANKDLYPDGEALLTQLDVTNPYQQSLITDAGLDYTTVQADYKLLGGRSALLPFKKLAYDGSSRLLSIIEYPAGAGVGDLSSITKYHYTGAATNPDIVTTEPYTLTSGDIVLPPF